MFANVFLPLLNLRGQPELWKVKTERGKDDDEKQQLPGGNFGGAERKDQGNDAAKSDPGDELHG